MTEHLNIEFHDKKLVPLLFGEHNAHITYLEKQLNILIADRGSQLILQGNPKNIKLADQVLHSLWEQLQKGRSIDFPEIDAALRFASSSAISERRRKKMSSTQSDSEIVIKTKHKSISPRTPNQAKYIKSIMDHEMVFGIGPAGTGKTYLAVAMAVSMFLQGEVERLIFTRPAVEAGENLGFLPGDMQEKVDPYVRPIYDALHDMLPMDFLLKKMAAGDIEVAPLAFMRGRTLQNAFVILDEAQNTTSMQMKMFLTRMGESSRMVITGDPTQIDLPHGQKSGLHEACDILNTIDEIAFHKFTHEDVVRHKLVGKIIRAYDRHH